MDVNIAEIFDAFPETQRKYLLQLRALILKVAETESSICALTETLKWGQVSYLTQQTKVGSTIRIGQFGTEEVALFFHCQTNWTPLRT